MTGSRCPNMKQSRANCDRKLLPAGTWRQTGSPAKGSLQPVKKCDSIICANDFTAAERLKTLTSLKIEVPSQVRVVGFDDVRYATLLQVSLTTIHQPCREIAQTAFRAMLERIKEPTIPPGTLTLAPRLVVRDSCGAYQR